MQAISVPLALTVIAFAFARPDAIGPKLDLNPALGAYQDERDCFPSTSQLHQIYRNFKTDPYFGGAAKCVKADPTGPLVNSQVQANFEYGRQGVLNTTLTLSSTPGYTAANLLEFEAQDGSNRQFNLTAAYRDCRNCKVFRHWYIDNGNGCSYWVTDQALGEETTCCEFVYDLLCGTQPRYHIYDENCQCRR